MKIKKIMDTNNRKKFKKMLNYAFGEWKDEKIKDDELSWFENAEVLGVFENKKLASGLVLHDFEQIIRGSIKNMGGIGGVATYPEFRNRGFVSSLMKKAFDVMNANKQCVSMLLPFKETFYEKYQYVSTNNNMRVEFDLQSFKHYKNIDPEGKWKEIRKESRKAEKDFLKLMEKVAPDKYHGLILYSRKIKGIWKKMMKNNMFIFIERDGDIAAGARYTKKGFQEMFDTGKIDVKEMYWEDSVSRGMLLKYFAKHLDQIKKIKFLLPYGLNFYSWVKNNIKIDISVDDVPWMVRIIDVEKALKNIPANAEGEVNIKIEDPNCSWNSNVYKIEGNGKKLLIEKTDEDYHINADIQAITALLYGAYNLEEVKNRFKFESQDSKKEKILRLWFEKRFIFNTFYF